MDRKEGDWSQEEEHQRQIADGLRPATFTDLRPNEDWPGKAEGHGQPMKKRDGAVPILPPLKNDVGDS